ncbi:hypothetical protein BHM03_00012401 [Ensete ventricosum]|uniref:DUF4228 domain-containing protein n=1 Tax=Ensete ventricosum TaxID=4639 RepID=A0A426XDM7_ENSVE|nr:hypothetical protein B296_00049308 [Ensete ventricosum]RZR85422.1 hypothetical protein BHM03_00012401 [Ensete ventricosum]
MKEAIRCCISCILPCGALDVIRIVHANGRVEEISGTVSAGEIMQAYPKHVLRRPPSPSSSDGADIPKAVVLPPAAELQKGTIYFLVPVTSAAPVKARSETPGPRRRRKKKKEEAANVHVAATDKTRLLLSDQYLSEILSEKVSTQRERRRGRVGVWRPHLESISEVSNDL